MRMHGKIIVVMLSLVFVASIAWGESTLKKYGDVEGRTFHANLYKDSKCTSCHGPKGAVGLPADDVCLKCHDLEKLVVSTARPEEDKWQNPHNNLHWGKEMPCMECHSEHQEGKPFCQGCHSFKYPKYKN